MISLLLRYFVKDYQHTHDAQVRRSYGILCSMVGIGLNIVLFIGKYFAGSISGSIAIMADAFNNLSDAGSSLMTLIGFKFAGMKPDHEHPFGHGRIEYIAGLGVSMAIILMGFELGKTSIDKIIHPEDVETSVLTLCILGISILVKLYMSYYNRHYGQKIDSPTMKATAMDSLSDALSTTMVALSMIVMYVFHINIDGWSGLLVAVFILYAGYNAAKETLSPLLGQAPDPQLVDEIKNIVLSHEAIVGIHDLVIHDYGPGRLMISLHGEVPGDGDIFALHDEIDHIEMELHEKLGCEAVIHMDPVETNNEVVAMTKQQVLEKVQEIDSRLTLHDFRMVQGPTHTNLIFDVVVPYNFNMSEALLKETLLKKVQEINPTYLLVVKIDQPYV